MILIETVIHMYLICTFTTIADEVWNMTHPRPYPTQEYYSVQWEELNFYEVNGQWMIREFRETDDEKKAFLRKIYWRKQNVLQHKQRKKQHFKKK